MTTIIEPALKIADQTATTLIDQLPEKFHEPAHELRRGIMGGLNDMKRQRAAETLNEKRPAADTGLNEMKKEKMSTWDKIKNGFSKFWSFASKPIKALVGMIPGVGGSINKGIEMAEKYVPQGVSAIEGMIARRKGGK